nr:MAG TPA: hypothetical protein [Caudoviricetes sp.]
MCLARQLTELSGYSFSAIDIFHSYAWRSHRVFYLCSGVRSRIGTFFLWSVMWNEIRSC